MYKFIILSCVMKVIIFKFIYHFIFYYIFREGNACADKLVNLGFIHRESFHRYNRFPSSILFYL